MSTLIVFAFVVQSPVQPVKSEFAHGVDGDDHAFARLAIGRAEESRRYAAAAFDRQPITGASRR
jgi:hypothetical protein